MNQFVIGKFILQKRKEKNLTQEQLAEKLGVSNKTVSKWETGKCMPDYGIIKNLCKELEISIEELIEGKETEQKNQREYTDKQIMKLLQQTQELEKQKNLLYGILLIVMGIALSALSSTFGDSNIKDLISGFLLGISIIEMLVGVYVLGRSLSKR